jgi:hypothetical protein
MEIQAGPLDWASNDYDNWAAFLNTETGRRFLPRLLESVPPLIEGGDTNAILIRTGVVRGFQLAVQELARMARNDGPPPKVVDTHPPLEDDKAWNDGQTLDPNPPARPVLEPDFSKV